MGFDIARIDAAKEKREAGHTFTVNDPKTGQPMEGVTITVASYSSERVRAKAREIAKQWEARKRRDDGFMPGLDETERLTKAMAHAAIISWDGFENGGKAWPVCSENIERLLDEPTIAAQIDKAASSEANFFDA